MGGFLAAIGFAFPYALAALLPVVGLLIYAYRRRGQGQQVQVASVLLLRNLRHLARSRSKVILPLRFFFELLLLALLIAGMAGLFMQGKVVKVAVIVDNSFSMLSRSGTSSSNYLDAAREEAAGYLRFLGAEYQIELFASSPELRSISQGFVAPAQAEELLAGISAAFAPDNLDAAIARLLGGQYRQVVVVSDRKRGENETGKLEERLLVRPVRGGEPWGNVAVNHVAWRGALGSEKAAVEAGVSSFAQRAVDLEVLLERIEAAGSRIMYLPIGRKKLHISQGATERVSFDLPAASTGTFRVRLEFAPLTAASLNAIVEDDSAWVSSGVTTESFVLVSDLPARALGLDRISGVTFTHVKPEDFGGRADEIGRGEFGAAIFHRFVPDLQPPLNAVFVLPERGTSIFSVTSDLRAVELSRWETAHPVLNYINFGAMRLPRVATLQSQWLVSVLGSTGGDVMLAGEIGKQRMVVTGFELFPLKIGSSPALGVLTLNILKYLANLGGAAGYLPASSGIEITEDLQRVAYVDGPELFNRSSEQAVGSSESPAPRVICRTSGLLRVERTKKEPELVGVNYFDPVESDTLSSRALAAPELRPGGGPVSDERINLDRILAQLLLLLVLLDLIYAGWQPFKGGSDRKKVEA